MGVNGFVYFLLSKQLTKYCIMWLVAVFDKVSTQMKCTKIKVGEIESSFKRLFSVLRLLEKL